jgi:thiol-disulfide isomerase/thioredoxin
MIGKIMFNLIGILVVMLASGCIYNPGGSGNYTAPTGNNSNLTGNNTAPAGDNSNLSGNWTNTADLVMLEEEGLVAQAECAARGISDKVLVLHSRYCSACRVALPRLAETETTLGRSFVYMDISQQEDIERMKSFGITIAYTPTVTVGCRILIGAKSTEEYKQIIGDFYGINGN